MHQLNKWLYKLLGETFLPLNMVIFLKLYKCFIIIEPLQINSVPNVHYLKFGVGKIFSMFERSSLKYSQKYSKKFNIIVI